MWASPQVCAGRPLARTKTLADRRARAAIAEGVPLSVVYPGVIYGPGELTEGNIVVRHVLEQIAAVDEVK
jgi:nucleoside-diphosphate-sugar epimerase